MYHPMYYCSAVIFVLLNLYCYASPIATTDEQVNKQLKGNDLNPTNQLKLKEFYYLKMLCKRYGRCHDDDDHDDEDEDEDDDTKQKRLSSSLFHGIPKFGKRAFKSAFAGLPKFG